MQAGKESTSAHSSRASVNVTIGCRARTSGDQPVLDNGRLPASRNIGISGVRKVTLGANTNAYYPRVARNGGKNTNVQSRYLQNAAYCRLKNIQIGYTLPKTWTEKAGMSSVRVYVSGDNLLTF